MSIHQPRFTPSPQCHLPPKPAPLTEAQQTALDALRTHIHASVAKTDAQKRWASDACLIRYLKSKKWNLQESKQAVQDTMLWREEYKPSIPNKDMLWAETAPGKLYVSGFDMESRPLLYMKPRLENTTASAAQIRHVVFHLEVALALMPEGVQNLCIIIDFAGSSMTKNPGVGVARDILHVLGNHYPERLCRAYIIHAPWFFFPFYKLVSPFIDPVTKAKLNFVDMKKQKPKAIVSTPSSADASETDLPSSASTTSNSKKVSSTASPSTSTTASGSPTFDSGNLLDVIPDDMLERDFGGSSDYVYHQELYWSAAEKVLEEARNALEQGFCMMI
ncbi:hypothetical protein BGZ70_004534 [Mortierella alpina]|uniref:CRAL-TRIO domain-containing protein n=1 Tax=Mortierella alpina TaxID=64518 RepID=A0A9P6JEH9_MORAP|nr:hypothetical protein BGZ70_004534 [Mortierella alpina]